MESNKELVKVSIYKKDAPPGEQNITYEGRFIGVVESKMFNAIVKNKLMAKKVFTKETELFDKVASNKMLIGNRIVIAIKKKNNIQVDKKLFISEKITTLSSVCYGATKKSKKKIIGNKSYIEEDLEKIKITIIGNSGSNITITEFLRTIMEE